jgi:hypothetical protein
MRYIHHMLSLDPVLELFASDYFIRDNFMMTRDDGHCNSDRNRFISFWDLSFLHYTYLFFLI